MDKPLIKYLKLLLAAVLLTFCTVTAYADKTVADLTGEDLEMYEMFRHLFVNGSPDEFYSYAEEYSKDLHDKGYMMLYYKLLSNKGFYALRHNQVYRAIQFAEALDHEVREDGASDYYYLATGLYGDIYSSSHDKARGERYFTHKMWELPAPKVTALILLGVRRPQRVPIPMETTVLVPMEHTPNIATVAGDSMLSLTTRPRWTPPTMPPQPIWVTVHALRHTRNGRSLSAIPQARGLRATACTVVS